MMSAAAQPTTMTGDGNGPAPAPAPLVGLVDGSVPATTSRFHVVLADDAVAQLDELVATTQTLPDAPGDLTHYGIVVEGTRPDRRRRASLRHRPDQPGPYDAGHYHPPG